MAKRQHPNDEQLLELVDESLGEGDESRARTRAHVETCAPCTQRISELRYFVTLLREHDVWKILPANSERRRALAQQAGAIAQQMRAEMDAAANVVAEVIAGPSQWWRKRVEQAEGTRTVGFVRRLLERAEKLSERSPADAVEATAIAVELAEELRVDAYPFDIVINLRAGASREHAYSLFYIGRFPDALKAVERAEHLFGQLPFEVVDLARAWLTRAMIYRAIDRQAEGITLSRQAASVFRSFGLSDRYVKARFVEGMMLHQLGRLAEALEVWKSIEDEPALRRDVSFGMLLQNIGTAYYQSGELEAAQDYLTRALAEYERRGVETEKVRTRWSMASTLVAGGRLAEALPVLRETWREFEALEMHASGALVALEIAEVLLIMGKPQDVPKICRTILDQFTQLGMTSRAITALSFLREALALGKGTPSLIRLVHDFIRDLPGNPRRRKEGFHARYSCRRSHRRSRFRNHAHRLGWRPRR